MMCNCSGYCIDKSCKYAPKQTLSKCENSQKKLFPVALDTAPYSQKHSNFHRCFPIGFTPESVSLRRRIVCSPILVSSLHQKVTFLYLFNRGEALSSRAFIC